MSSESKEILMFNLGTVINTHYLFYNCKLFATLLSSKLSNRVKNKILIIAGEHYVVKYKNYYIDVYGIHTEYGFLSRNLNRIVNGKNITLNSYIEDFEYSIDNIAKEKETTLDYHTKEEIEMANIIIDPLIDIILNL